ncbi:hypothetical protein PHBOTO_000269 [Pseudozyma hubeiensis]|nr:hypothetical protein PHBOTO_000269 [Pseudozyma hubeiensis]
MVSHIYRPTYKAELPLEKLSDVLRKIDAQSAAHRHFSHSVSSASRSPRNLVLLHRILAYSSSPTTVGHFGNCSIDETASVVAAASLASQRAFKCQTSVEVPNHTRLVSCTRNTIFGSHVSTIVATPLYYRAL